MIIRVATEQDIDEIVAIDQLAMTEGARQESIRDWIKSGSAIVAIVDELIIGYAVLEYSFFSHGFISMLVVKDSYRRQGAASKLLRSIEEMCKTEKLFTSTNQSNSAMQALMAHNSYESSGIVYNLDEGDPEIFYFKRLNLCH